MRKIWESNRKYVFYNIFRNVTKLLKIFFGIFSKNATKHLKIFFDIKTFSRVFSKIQLNT